MYEQGKVVFRVAFRQVVDRVTIPSPFKPLLPAKATRLPTPAQITQLRTANISGASRAAISAGSPREEDSGPVVLSALVGTDGAVRELKVVSGDPLLAKAATDAVRRWRFQPHRQNGRLVEFETQITVNFALPQ